MQTQAVKAGGLISEDRPVNTGVTQGSILGPLLFLMYVNDLPSVTPGLSLYADDAALHRSASTEHELTVSLQQGINDMVNWMKIWKLQPNVQKTKVLYISARPPSAPLTFPNCTQALEVVTSHRHLGIVLDSKLSWSEHADHICLKASRILGTLKPHCRYLPHDCRSLFLFVQSTSLITTADITTIRE